MVPDARAFALRLSHVHEPSAGLREPLIDMAFMCRFSNGLAMTAHKSKNSYSFLHGDLHFRKGQSPECRLATGWLNSQAESPVQSDLCENLPDPHEMEATDVPESRPN
jgi:hypothetical protein